MAVRQRLVTFWVPEPGDPVITDSRNGGQYHVLPARVTVGQRFKASASSASPYAWLVGIAVVLVQIVTMALHQLQDGTISLPPAWEAYKDVAIVGLSLVLVVLKHLSDTTPWAPPPYVTPNLDPAPEPVMPLTVTEPPPAPRPPPPPVSVRSQTNFEHY